MLDTNIVVDYLCRRAPHDESARLLMIGGRVGEFDLWLTSSQLTDLVYILSEGGRAALMPGVLDRLRGLRTFVNVYPIDAECIDRMLATTWKDPEDALLFDAALQVRADFLVTRNAANFESGLVNVVDCPGFFESLKREFGLAYDEVGL